MLFISCKEADIGAFASSFRWTIRGGFSTQNAKKANGWQIALRKECSEASRKINSGDNNSSGCPLRRRGDADDYQAERPVEAYAVSKRCFCCFAMRKTFSFNYPRVKICRTISAPLRWRGISNHALL
jgi:hypothetical protein